MPKRLGRPPKPPAERRVTLAVRVRQATRAEIERLAAEMGISHGELLDAYVDGPRPRKPAKD